MSRQLNLRVSDEFAERLERVARKVGRPMAAVLETLGTQALEAVESDARFEAEALAAWEDYQLNGARVEAVAIEAMFDVAQTRAKAVAKGRGQ